MFPGGYIYNPQDRGEHLGHALGLKLLKQHYGGKKAITVIDILPDFHEDSHPRVAFRACDQLYDLTADLITLLGRIARRCDLNLDSVEEDPDTILNLCHSDSIPKGYFDDHTDPNLECLNCLVLRSGFYDFRKNGFYTYSRLYSELQRTCGQLTNLSLKTC